MKALATADQRIQEFGALIQTGVESWTRAGKVLCRLVDEDPAIYGKILEELPYLTREVLESFEAIGRKTVYPYLIVDGSPGARRLASLPYADQVRIYNTRIAVVVQKGGVTQQTFKRVPDLTAAEAERVFEGGKVRTVQEQMHLLARPRRKGYTARSSRLESELEPEAQSSVGTASLDEKPADELQRLLTLANDALLESRSVLASIKRGSRQDQRITVALREIGELRFAVREGDL